MSNSPGAGAGRSCPGWMICAKARMLWRVAFVLIARVEMPPLPYRKLELQSTLSAAVAMQILADAVEPKRWFRLGPGMRPFEGTVAGLAFDMRRIMSSRNSFLPQIRGTITPNSGGCRISLTMRLHLGTMLFMVVWLAGLLVVAFGFASAAFNGAEVWVATLPLGMLLFVWGLSAGAFSLEARKAEELLTFLLDARRD
jgi:hypothetical protein